MMSNKYLLITITTIPTMNAAEVESGTETPLRGISKNLTGTSNWEAGGGTVPHWYRM